MKRLLLSMLCFSIYGTAAQAAEPPAVQTLVRPADPSAPLRSGIDMNHVDSSVRPQDDLSRYVNGRWLATTEIPADKPAYGAGSKIYDDTQLQLKGIVEKASREAHRKADPAQRIGDLYLSFMDEARLETLGVKPLAAEFARIDALKNRRDIAAEIAHLEQIGVNTPYAAQVHQDNKDSTRYIVDLGQGGLGLPDRDYYLDDGDAKLSAARAKYRAHVGKMLAMAGDGNAEQDAAEILALETELARAQWTKVELRDPIKAYNKVALKQLDALASGYDWNRYIAGAGIKGKVSYLIVSQPSYITAFGKILEQTPVTTWKTYFRWQLLSAYAPYLSKPYVDANFAFYGTVLSGTPEIRERWKRGVQLVDHSIGEDLGRLYVEQYFPPESKARMDALVGNLLAAYRQSISGLDWMSATTKAKALEKLAKFTPKIGYPKKWRDYSTLTIRRTDLVGNVMRANEFEYRRNVAKLGKPIDRDEWLMTPQTVNAYYNPELNEIVFPAAILQPPFFDAQADDAVNYGAIGSTIGHEISHGFDDEGSQYDGDGNLNDWWTPEDHAKFAAKTKALVAQYSAYEPVPGYHVNGELTLGENIADNSGLAIAYKAYHLSLHGKEAPVIDGLTGDQRFFMGSAQSWRTKMRDDYTVRLLKSDPHSPNSIRSNAAAINQSAFYSAFDVKPGDKMYLPPEKRVTIW
ncbi:MAG TPA: M13-type metalloendopeptidase [Casimicrobiaceae bacterium]|jgi:predicted metalloendopeptidase